MNLVEIYIETGAGIYEKLDMFGDESINIKYKLKDTSDISKIFSTYSQTFSIPASQKNSLLIKYFFNPEVVRGSSRFINAKIYVNKQLFKFGKTSLNLAKLKMGLKSSYSLNFFTGAGTLKDIVGETKLSELNVDPYNFSWTSGNFYFGLTNPIGEDVIVPLISNERVWSYNDASPTDIKWVNSSTTLPKAINYTELRPAMRFGKIMENIIEHFNLDIEAPLFSRTEYTKLFIHLTKDKIESTNTQVPVNSAFGSYTDKGTPAPKHWDISVDTTTDVFTITRTVDSSQKGNFFMRMTPTAVMESDVALSVDVEYIDLRPTSLTYNQVIFRETVLQKVKKGIIESVIPLETSSFGGITVANPFIFKINTKWSNVVSYNDGIFALNISGADYYYSKRSTLNIGNANNVVDLHKMIPDMKVIDFLSSFFKLFNIRVREDNTSAKLYFETPIDFVGVEKDFTPYTDIQEASIVPQDIFKVYKFTHAESKYKSNIDYTNALSSNVNSKAFGQLLYNSPNDYAKGEYTVETKFSIVPPVTIDNTRVQTQYGFNGDKPTDDSVYGTVASGGGKYIPNFNELTLFYYNGMQTPQDINLNNISFGFRDSESTITRQVTSYPKVGIADTDNISTYTNSLGFKDEVNLLPVQFVCSEHNLYINNYSDLVIALNTPNILLFTFTCFLPAKEINEFDLRNDLIIGEYKFNIEEADINIVTGKATLVLSNKI